MSPVHTYVALLRAVNLGARHRLPMARLRELAEIAGATRARTYLQSGNVVLDAEQSDPDAVAEVLRAVLADDGLATEVVVRPAEAIVELASAGHPHDAGQTTPQNLQVAFPVLPVSREAVAGVPIAGDEQVSWWRGEIALHYPSGMGRSKLTTAHLAKHLGTPVTCRNWRTVRAVSELAAT
ncbi:DUF1697 domain-containing protein [Saccharopolyspora griseoalba]|uniref:DUF1697 domain-containing protein n=1 Tax=Saccharopolyspora griseoalba TaxID=1431848 RepID=A0ABW2LCY7_9PSEU